jgi:hypothetical protein
MMMMMSWSINSGAHQSVEPDIGSTATSPCVCRPL